MRPWEERGRRGLGRLLKAAEGALRPEAPLSPRPPGPSCGNGRALDSHLHWGASLPGTEGGAPETHCAAPRPEQGRLSSLGGERCPGAGGLGPQSRGHRPWTECGARAGAQRVAGPRQQGVQVPFRSAHLAGFGPIPSPGSSMMFLSAPPLKTKHFFLKTRKLNTLNHFRSGTRGTHAIEMTPPISRDKWKTSGFVL